MATPDRTLITEADLVTPSPLKTALDGKASTDHSSTHATGGSDPLTPADIGAVPAGAVALPTTTDLNDLTENATYLVTGAGATTALNYPADNFRGYIESVYVSASHQIQKAYARNSEPVGAVGERTSVYYRTKVGTTWMSWMRVDPGAVAKTVSDRAPQLLPNVNLFPNPYLIEAYGAIEGISADWEWVPTGGIMYTVGGTGYSTKIPVPVGTVVTATAFVKPNPASPNGSFGLTIQNTTLGSAAFDYTGEYASYSKGRTIPPEGAVVSVTHTVSTDGFRWRTSGSGHLVSITVSRGPASPGVHAAPSIQTLRGTGQPNGVVTAPVGSEYIDLAATAGARKWYKASGVGNIGWIVTDGDTGWVNAAAWLNSALTISTTPATYQHLSIRRTAQEIYISTMVNSNAVATSLFNISLPVGWRVNIPTPLGRGLLIATTPSPDSVVPVNYLGGGYIGTNGTAVRFSLPAGHTMSLEFTGLAEAAWPTTLAL